VNNRILLLGDAANMASPRTGAGAYTAMVDAVVLEAALKQGKNIDESLKLYNQNTVDRGKELYHHSRKSASYFAFENRKIISPKVLIERLQSQQTLNME
jgi:2-polyprenyl-6-methoxyphenol hydroxylase-like FAD-dependent oxidoreductase